MPQPRRPESGPRHGKGQRLEDCHTLKGAAAKNTIRTESTIHGADHLAQGHADCGSPVLEMDNRPQSSRPFALSPFRPFALLRRSFQFFANGKSGEPPDNDILA